MTLVRIISLSVLVLLVGCTENMRHTDTARTVSEATAAGALIGAVLGGRDGAQIGAAIGMGAGLIVADAKGGYARKETLLNARIRQARAEKASLDAETARLRRLIASGKATRASYERHLAALRQARRARRDVISLRPRARSDAEASQFARMRRTALDGLEDAIARAEAIAGRRPAHLA